MKFGEKSISECLGDLLVHSVRIPNGKLPKGTKLSKTHIQSLRSMGIERLLVASLQKEDVDENLAAKLLSTAFYKTGFKLSVPSTGRVNFIAEHLSISRLDVKKINRLNEIDEAITFATVLPDQLLTKGQMVATLKIIPYAVSKRSIDKAIKLIKSGKLLSCHQIISRNFSLIQTKFEDTKPSILLATENVTRTRLAQLECSLIDCQIVGHSAEYVSQALIRAREQGAQAFLLCGASAIADRVDVLPKALRIVGGEIFHFGLPVDPGNLSMVGSRPLPRKLVNKKISREKQVAGIILAGGNSTRMGTDNKLLLPMNNGMTMISWIVQTYLKSEINKLIIVTGFQEKAVKKALLGFDVEFIHNPHYETGQASSVSAGILGLAEQCDSALIGLGDMPFVTTDLINRLIESHQLLPKSDIRITLPLLDGKRSNPVIWGRAFFEELRNISGDQGGRQIFADYLSAINGVSWDRRQFAEDIDQPEDRQKLSLIK